ncbi:MAG TPA: tRNA(His) guanylyltransferase Thg1 family protein [Methanosarcina sp.]|nr:tRNA(His) guanylyltransferase Thg1 family protein [Methanosarcina sp.]
MDDVLGDKIKRWELQSTYRKAFPGQPFVVRMDGRSFHTFTKGLKRPYDENFSKAIIETTRMLVDEFGAKAAYTQSDEITLYFYNKDDKSEYIFGGRFQKIESIFAAKGSVYFNQLIQQLLPHKANLCPVLDCRAFAVPTLDSVYEVFYWRQEDAKKNAISMAAQSNFSHKFLQGKHSKEMIDMMYEKGIIFQDYPSFFRRGTFLIPEKRELTLTEEQLSKIPEKYRSEAKTCIRTVIEEKDYNLPRIFTWENEPEFYSKIHGK